MPHSRPDEYEHAIEQIREGKLDPMLSEMFGGEEAPPSADQLTTLRDRRWGAGLNAILVLVGVAGGMVAGWLVANGNGISDADRQLLADVEAELGDRPVQVASDEEELSQLELLKRAAAAEVRADLMKEMAQDKFDKLQAERKELLAWAREWIPRIEAAIEARETYDAMGVIGLMAIKIDEFKQLNDAQLVSAYADLIRQLLIDIEAQQREAGQGDNPAAEEDDSSPPGNAGGQ